MQVRSPMSVKVRVRSTRPASGRARGYRIRPTSFIFSIAFHVVLVGALLLVPVGNRQLTEQSRERPIYDELIRPEEKKIIWYSPPKEKLPEVSAQERVGTFPAPRAPLKSELAIIATAPQPKSVKQFIWQPVPTPAIRQDLRAPNLISPAAMAIPAPPPPPAPKPKIDKPDTAGAKAPQPNISQPNPQGDVAKAEQTTAQPLEVPKPRKQFVPPAPS